MATTATVPVPIELRGSFVRTNTESAHGEQGSVRIQTEGVFAHQLSRLEQIVEYLRVLYR
jgi:hypothetical protein